MFGDDIYTRKISLLSISQQDFCIRFVQKVNLMFFNSCYVINNVSKWKTLHCVDSGNNVEQSSSQNMLTQLKYKKNTCTNQLESNNIYKKNEELIKLSFFFYPHNSTSVFLPPLLFSIPNFN